MQALGSCVGALLLLPLKKVAGTRSLFQALSWAAVKPLPGTPPHNKNPLPGQGAAD